MHRASISIEMVTGINTKTKIEKRLLFRTIARKLSDIDFFLKISPLKDDKLVMSEM